MMTYRTTTIDDLDFGGDEPLSVRLYVYSIANNPSGPDSGTNAQSIGIADSRERAEDLWDAALATARVIYGEAGGAEIGLCVSEA